MKELLLSTLLMSLQNTIIQFAPLIVTSVTTGAVTWGVAKLRKLLASNEKLKGIEITKEGEEKLLREALKITLAVEEKFSKKVKDKLNPVSAIKQEEAAMALSAKFPDMNPEDIVTTIKAVLPDMRTIFNPKNPTTLVK
jgi:hypothetical protein